MASTGTGEIDQLDKEETNLLVLSNKKVKAKVTFRDIVVENQNSTAVTSSTVKVKDASDDDMEDGEDDDEYPTFRIKSALDIIDVGNDVYVVRFYSMEEYDRALYNGPWIIANHYLAVCQRYHDFDPNHFSVSRLAVWVRFPNLSLKYFDEQILMRLVRLIGRLLKVDTTTLGAIRGRFALLCVEVDLSKPLLAKFCLRRKIRKIEYESMHTICFNCGMYGHRLDACNSGNSEK
ncbi:hypothetical protein DITRI_Ditri05aG0029600 [Diplodiscus trichospermus]